MPKRSLPTIQIPRDWSEFVAALVSAKVKFIVVGSHALAAHGRPRFSGDIDVFIAHTPSNIKKVVKAMADFGFDDPAAREWLSVPGNGLHLGVHPMRIDVLTSISGVTFDEAWKTRKKARFNSSTVNIIGRETFIKNKRAAGRPKDLVDIALLEEVDEAIEPPSRGTKRSLASYDTGDARFMRAKKRRR